MAMEAAERRAEEEEEEEQSEERWQTRSGWQAESEEGATARPADRWRVLRPQPW